MSENGEIYTGGKNFTLPPAVTALTNLTSAPDQRESPHPRDPPDPRDPTGPQDPSDPQEKTHHTQQDRQPHQIIMMMVVMMLDLKEDNDNWGDCGGELDHPSPTNHCLRSGDSHSRIITPALSRERYFYSRPCNALERERYFYNLYNSTLARYAYKSLLKR